MSGCMVTKLPELLRKKGRGLAPDRSHFAGYVSILLNATGLRKGPGIGYTLAQSVAVPRLFRDPFGLRFCAWFGGALNSSPVRNSGHERDRTAVVVVFGCCIGIRRSGMAAVTCVVFFRQFRYANCMGSAQRAAFCG
jgi:hypothetical protein